MDVQQPKPKTHISQVDGEGDDDDDNGDDYDEDHDDDDEADLDKEDGGALAPSCGYHLLTAPHLQAVSPAVRLLIFFIGFFNNLELLFSRSFAISLFVLSSVHRIAG